MTKRADDFEPAPKKRRQVLRGNSEMNQAERVATRVIEGILPGTMVYQPKQSHGEYDFELRYHSGTTAAVEVTMSADLQQLQTIAAIRNEKKGGSSIPATKCEKSWLIFPAKGARIDRIRMAADDRLSRLEQAGRDEFSWVRDWHHQCVQDVCRNLKITSGSVIRTGAAPMIRIASPGGGGAVGASTAIAAGEKEAWKQDNRKKLGAAKTAERHLVVYIDPMNGLPWVALTDFRPPSALPNLPEEITDIWLVGHAKENNEFVDGVQVPTNLGIAWLLRLRTVSRLWLKRATPEPPRRENRTTRCLVGEHLRGGNGFSEVIHDITIPDEKSLSYQTKAFSWNRRIGTEDLHTNALLACVPHVLRTSALQFLLGVQPERPIEMRDHLRLARVHSMKVPGTAVSNSCHFGNFFTDEVNFVSSRRPAKVSELATGVQSFRILFDRPYLPEGIPAAVD